MTSTRGPRQTVILFGPGLDEPGGMAKRSRLIVAGLVERGWRVKVLSRMGPSRRFRVRHDEGLAVLEVPGFSSRVFGGALYLFVAVTVGLIWSIRADRLVAVHLSSPSTAAAIVSLLSGRPFLALTTSSGSLSEVTELHRGRLASIRRWLLQRAEAFVVQTEHSAREVREVYPHAATIVLPSPVELVNPPPPLSGRPRVLFVGRFSEEKDLPILLDVWRRLAADRPGSLLTLVGSGGSFRSVESEVREMVGADEVLHSSVSLTGWVDDVVPYLSSADVFVLPSRSEGMSNALLEACAMGRVVVAASIPSHAELLGSAYPLLFQAGDSISLESKLRVALENDAIRKRVRERVLSVAACASKDIVVDRLETVLAHDVAYSTRDQHAYRDRGS